MANNQANQALPPVDVPFLDDRGHVSTPWYYFLFDLWMKAGAGTSQRVQQVYLQNQDSVNIFNSSGGTLVGPVPLFGTADGDQLVMQALTQSVPPDHSP